MTFNNQLSRFVSVFLVGVAVSACTLTDNNVSQATPDFNGEPIVRLASPLPNETYATGAAVNILGRIENAGTDVALVDILLDNQSIGSATDPNQSGAVAFTITNSWLATLPGDHVIMLRVVRADGTSADASVNISVEGDQVVQAVASPTTESLLPPPVVTSQTQPTLAATLAVQPPVTLPTTSSDTAAPTTAPILAAPTSAPPPVSNVPTVTVISGANIRSGPSIGFVPVLGSLAAGATGTIIAISPDSQWYRITYNNGAGSGWVSATTVTTSGNLSGLPIDAGPATPAPTAVPPTTAPATTVPTANTDLSITLLTANPDPLVCNQAATITAIVVNTGTTPSAATTLLLQDLYNDSQAASASQPVGPLAQNESVSITFSLNVSTNYNEGHTLRARIDPDNVVPENNEGNNDNSKAYTLGQGGC